MTVLPRAATAGELAKLRSDNQSSRLYLTIHQPATIYTARLAAVPSSTDSVTSITYNTGSGTLANVLADMTMYIGSTAGAYDLGIARIRKDGVTTAATFYIAEESEINWQSNAYLTVVNDFDLWPRHIKIAADGTTPLMDYDVAYTNQNQAVGSTPFPIMGSDVVLWLDGSTVSYSPDASNSWVNGGTIASYAWTATGASATANMATATPTITYNAVGTYRLDCTVTGDNGVAFTGYRRVFVVTEASGVVTSFTLDGDVSGDYESGGWSFRVTLFDEAALSSVMNRALVILHSRDWYGSTAGSVGYLPGSENIIASGRIAGESIQWNVEYKPSFVSFDVQGPHYWLGQMTAFPSGVKDVSDATTPNKWTKFRGLTLNKCWYHFMMWRTTAARCMDVYPNTDTRRIKRLEAPGGQNIWSQLTEIAERSILARPCCDRYGRVFLEINQQLLTDRSGVPTVQALTSSDWHDQIGIDRTPTPRVGLVDMSGVAWDGTAPTAFFSLAPGHVFKHHGSVEVADRLALVDQADTNALNGLYIAWKNNNYARLEIKLASNHRLIDIAPQQRVTLSLAATDTPRGIAESFSLIPRSLAMSWQNGYMLTSGTFEDEVVADLAITGDTPQIPPDPPILPIDPPIDPPPIDPVLPSDASEMWGVVTDGAGGTDYLVFSNDFDFKSANNSASWNVYNPTPLDALSDSRIYGAIDGSALYLYSTSSQTIWACTNLQTVRATPATTPTFSVIADLTTDTGIGALTAIHNPMKVWRSTLCVTGRVGSYYVYGEYTPLAGWTWSLFSYPDIRQANGLTYRALAVTYDAGLGYVAIINPKTNAVIYNYGAGASVGDAAYQAAWRNMQSSTSALYFARSNSGPKILDGVGGSAALASSVNSGYFSGAPLGNQFFAVLDNGALYYSAGGITLTAGETWQCGQVFDAKSTGGGTTVWALSNVAVPNSNEIIRLSLTGAGGTHLNKTGNFWTARSWSGLGVNMGNWFVVYG